MSFAKTSIVIGGSTKELEAAVDRAMGKLSSMAAKVVGIFAGIATVKWGYELLKQSEASEIAFTQLLGSADLAKSTLKDIADFAASTPMDNPTLVKAYQTLLAFKFGAEDIPGILRTIGDTAAAMPGSMEENVQRLSVIMGQMRSKAKLSAGEMLQLTEAGVNAWEYLRQALKLDTVAEVVAMSERGAIDSATAVRAVLGGMEKDFAGIMEKRSKSVEGLISTIQDNAGRALNSVFKGATGGDFKKWLEEVGNGMNGLAAIGESVGEKIAAGFQVVKNIFDGVYAVASAIADVIVAAFGGPGLQSVGDFASAMKGIQTDFAMVKGIAMAFIEGIAVGFAMVGDAVNNYLVEPVKIGFGYVIQFVSRIMEATAQLLEGIGYISDTAAEMAKSVHEAAVKTNQFGEKLAASGKAGMNSGDVAAAAVDKFFRDLERKQAKASQVPAIRGTGDNPIQNAINTVAKSALDFGRKIVDMKSLLADNNAAMKAELKARQAKIDEERKQQADELAKRMKSPLEQFQDAMLELQQNPNLTQGERRFGIAEEFGKLASTLPQYQPNNALLAGSSEAQSTINAARFGSTKVEDVIRQAKDEAVATRRGVEELVRLLEKSKVIPAEI